ncbi:MAG: CheR family methyltransferase [Microscillaceae bacterium]|nr:CheR family methyltransferase [Microscillaceae bacterium]
MKNIHPYIIGIGASAGGLEAIQLFFDAIPISSNLAFVIIQHLSPDFKSLMPELLKKHTQLTIITAEEKQLILPNHIYLIPRKKILSIKNYQLVVTDKDPALAINFPIDTFFHSLGRELKEKAIGLILSGTGTDGINGLKTIKEAGGIVMVQSPESAKFDGMPQSALATGLIDIVGTPQELAHQCLYVTHMHQTLTPQVDKDKGEHYFSNEDLTFIIHTIMIKTGMDFQFYKKGTLERRLVKRLQIKGFESLYKYRDYLISHEEEAGLLAKEFLIGVTQFFRNHEAFSYLEQQLIPQIYKESQSDEIRVWCIGCSTGEEAYSIAMLLDEYRYIQKIPKTFKIFASDIDQEAIAKASQGKYGTNILADIPLQKLEKYFEKKGGNYEVRKELKNHIVFSHHNVLKDPPFINLDLVVCRNLLIYFDARLQKSFIERVQYSLNNNGFLFLGIGESLNQDHQFFETIDHQLKIYQKKNHARVYSPSLLTMYALPEKKDTDVLKNKVRNHALPTAKAISSRSDLENYADVLINHYAQHCLLVNPDLDVLYMVGEFNDILRFPANKSRFNLEYMLGNELMAVFRTGISNALNQNIRYTYKNVPFSVKEKTGQLELHFDPIWNTESQEKLIIIELVQKEDDIRNEVVEVFEKDTYARQQIQALELELKETKHRLKTIIEQYETTYEELQTTNEELMSSNEELQSTNEELQSVNEELYTVNTELQAKISEVTEVNNDLNNLLSSTDIGTIFLDRNLRIRKFTAAIEKQFSLQNSDIGRSISDFNDTIGFHKYIKDIQEVLNDYAYKEFEVRDKEDDIYLMKLNPFITSKMEIQGVVISFVKITAQKKAEEDLKISEARHRILIDHFTSFTFIHDSEGKIKLASPSLENYTGQPFESYQGDFWLNLIHPDDREDLARIWWDAVQNKALFENQNARFFNKTSEEYHHFITASVPFFDEEGQVKEWFGAGIDIQGLKNAEEALRQNEIRYQFLYNNTPAMQQTLDQTGNIMQVSKYWLEELGYAETEIIGRPFTDFMTPKSRKYAHEVILPLFYKTGECKNIPYQFVKKSGEVIDTLLSATSEKNGQGQITRSLAVITDITDKKKTEQALYEKEKELEIEKQFRFLTDYAPVFIWLSGLHQSRYHFNHYWLTFTGRKLDEERGLGWLDNVHPEDQEACRTIFQEAYDRKENYQMNYRLLRHDGVYRWILERGTPRFAKGKIFLGFVGSCIDFTEERETKEKLQSSNLELEQFAYVATHDLRSPIVNLQSLIALFYEQDFVTPENAFIADKIRSCTEEIHETLHDLIAVITEQKKLDETIKEVSFQDIFDLIYKGIEEQVKSTSAILHTDFSQIPTIYYIPGHLKSIFQNLLTNAIKYRSPDRIPEIYIKTYLTTEHICLSMKDNGIGIDMNKKDKVFGLFKRLSEKEEGKGIGLFLTKSQVESQGGKIDLESEPGKGTTFFVYLKNLKINTI